eukprot:m51a1_g5387 putative smad nuclear-interacting protein 1-like (249) ;mRNA; f:18288-19174
MDRDRRERVAEFEKKSSEPDTYRTDERWGRRRSDLDFEDSHPGHKRPPEDDDGPSPPVDKRARGPDDGQRGGGRAEGGDKERPNYEPSGALKGDAQGAAAVYKGRELKFEEPKDAALPTKRWRLYVFKGTTELDPIQLHRMSCYLLGRDREIVDVPLDHPSCSKQHAVFQYRQVTVTDDDGARYREVKPYLMDLGSANGTTINGEKLKPMVYVELRERDILKFGLSTRDYVLLHDGSATDDEPDQKQK